MYNKEEEKRRKHKNTTETKLLYYIR